MSGTARALEVVYVSNGVTRPIVTLRVDSFARRGAPEAEEILFGVTKWDYVPTFFVPEGCLGSLRAGGGFPRSQLRAGSGGAAHERPRGVANRRCHSSR